MPLIDFSTCFREFSFIFASIYLEKTQTITKLHTHPQPHRHPPCASATHPPFEESNVFVSPPNVPPTRRNRERERDNFLTPNTVPFPTFSRQHPKPQQMQQNPPTTPSQLSVPGAQSAAPAPPVDDPTFSSLFDWSDFLDFNLDESLTTSFPQSEIEQAGVDQSQPPQHSGEDSSGRIRKRDPRLTCSNFLAGVIPCACPELDAKLEEEEAALPGKKRTRTAKSSGGVPASCQVPGCVADISELKGYHKRHRVCLQCANASAVVLDGESKRYCQQCGKFHILSDFDEGKRSCRRKLERHNNRRRRKPSDSKESMGKDSQLVILADDVSGDDDIGKDGICKSSQIEEREILLESDAHTATVFSALGSENIQSDSVVSLTTSGDTYIEGGKQNPEYKRSPSYGDNKSSFSSLCPSGRISFKLYDWNPAEFPRRLRHQIFQWLASMPVELEGYIRPGCTILTAFIAMPKPAWIKLMEEPALYLKDLVASPGSVLSGRDTMHVYLNDMIFRVTKDATSVVKVNVKDQAPKLHYIYPTCFEAGRPMEFVACGSFLLQPNFRFLISFAGQYLAYNICISSPSCDRDAKSTDHQLLKIYVPQIDASLFGPGFIEVENQSGLSNFIPILVGDKECCTEMEILQQKFDTRISHDERQEVPPPQSRCEAFGSKQQQFLDFLLDIAWLLKKPASEQELTSSHMQRFNHLLEFLIEKESSIVLERVLCSLRSAIGDNLVARVSDSEARLLQRNMEIAQRRLSQNLLEKEISAGPEPDGSFYSGSSQNDAMSVVQATTEGVQRMVKNLMGPSQSTEEEDATKVPLLKGEVVVNVHLHESPRNHSHRLLLTRRILTSRPFVMAIAAIGICFGVCAVVFHPQRIGQIAISIPRCLFDNS